MSQGRRVAPLPPDWPARRSAVLARDRGRCWHCAGIATDVDHIVPVSRGGTDELTNLQSLCRPCHLSKTAREARGEPRKRTPEPHPGVTRVGDDPLPPPFSRSVG